MTAKGAAIAAALIFILICAILPASAGTVTYDKKTVAVSAESPLTLKKSTKHMFTVVPAEGEQTLVFDLSSRPDSVIIRHGSATVATFKPEAPQFTAGASDVLSFGPILVLDGRLRIHSPKIGAAKEPRTAIGWLGDRHYLAVTVEGRLKRSEGISMTALGQLMLARGCTQAINLDGGHTSVMMFMGERLNTIGSFKGSGATSGSRNLFELLGVGAEQ